MAIKTQDGMWTLFEVNAPKLPNTKTETSQNYSHSTYHRRLDI